MTNDDLLPSWRPGATRDAVTSFLDAASSMPPDERVACFDNDGTLWCERPDYAQLDFFVDALRARAAEDPTIADRAEFAAVLDRDSEALGNLGLPAVALALVSLFEGMEPAAFTARVREYMDRATHPTLARPVKGTVYQPMLELIAALRTLDFSVFLVTGGGTEFVRSVSSDLYGVAPEAVVGTLVAHDFEGDDQPVLRRSTRLLGSVDEGPAKVTNIQTQLGRKPIMAAGITGGDREMLQWATMGDGPRLALLIDHDDADREFSYAGAGATTVETEPIVQVGARLGWTVVSMRHDWDVIFPPDESIRN